MTGIPGILHVYGQVMPHDDVIIVGDRKGLAHLRAAIERALETDVEGSTEVMPNDGEHYDAKVRCLDENWQDGTWQSLQQPYSLYRKVDSHG